MALTTVLDLPSELVASIFQYLNTDDIFAARQSSKNLERASFSFFAKRFFRKKGYMITTPSLNVFNSVAAHEGLRPYVQHVWFNMDCYTFAGSDINFQNRGAFSGDSRSREAYEMVIANYEELIYGNRLRHELATGFVTLPNLKAVGMRRSEDHNPWGWSRLQAAIGRDPRVLGNIPSGESDRLSPATLLFIALIQALATSKAQIQRLYTDAVEIDNVLAISLPPDLLSKACNSILYLELNATNARLSPPAHDEPHTRLSRPWHHGEGLQRLLSATPNLREMGLQIFPDRKQSRLVPPNPREPDSWRQSYPYAVLSRLASNTDLQHLRRVKLEKFTSTPAIMRAFLEPSAAQLTSLKLRDVRLLASANPETAVSECAETRPWRAFFAFLATSSPSLSYLLLSHLWHAYGSVRFVPTLPSHDALPPSSMVVNPGDFTGGSFTDYENITVDVSGLREVQGRLRGLADAHWYGRYCFSYAMDEGVWHTDTSDEEW